MTITHKINMDLASKGIAPKFDMVQGDYCARQIEFRLFASNTPWLIPEDARALIRFRRSDQSVGSYDTLPDGTCAYDLLGRNRIAIFVAPEALAVPGTVMLVVTLYTREQELSTFEVQIQVQGNLSSGAALDGNYASITGMLPAPEGAPGQLLVVDTVSEGGKVRTVKAVTDADAVPDYVQAEANRLAALVQSRQNAHTFSFLIGSDIHLRPDHSTTAQTLTSTHHAAQAMEIIRKQVHLDCGVLLGDFLSDSGETNAQAMEAFRLIHGFFSPAFGALPQFWLKGDHDYLTDEEELLDDQVFAGISIYNGDAVFDAENKVGGYCYRDFDAFRLRVICLAFPIDGNGQGLSDTQVSWLEDALNVAEKGEQWRTLLLSHRPIDDFTHFVTMMNAVALQAGTILATLHGHTHNYQVGYLDRTSIPRIGIPAISPYGTKDLDGVESDDAPYQKITGSAEDTAFCVVTIDLGQQKLFLDHYGAGEDREINL